MPTRPTPPVGAPCWIDLMTSDPQRSRDFYTGLFGWEAEEPDPQFGGYFNYRRAGVRIAGCMANQQPGMPDLWSVYLASDDAAKTVERAKAAGAQVVVEAMSVADLGTMAVLIDPTGAGIGVWQPGTHPGFTVLGEPNSPGWFELLTRDHDQAVAFYRDVFGWAAHQASDTPEFRMTTHRDGDTDLAGIMDATGFLPEGVPAHWNVYFTVADADAAVAKAVELGATVEQPAEDTPYGKIAALVDPTGARLRLVGPNEAAPMR